MPPINATKDDKLTLVDERASLAKAINAVASGPAKGTVAKASAIDFSMPNVQECNAFKSLIKFIFDAFEGPIQLIQLFFCPKFMKRLCGCIDRRMRFFRDINASSFW